MHWLIALALLATGCGNRCKDVQRAKAALARPDAPNRGADLRVTVPYDHANKTMADLLAQEPVTMQLAPPEIAIFPVAIKPVAVVREVVLKEDGADGNVRLATRFEIMEGDTVITDVAAIIEIRPDVVKTETGADLVIGFGPQNLVRVSPKLGPDAKRTLEGAVDRWVPDRLRGKIPKFALEGAAKKLGTELTETAWDALREGLLKRLGDVTRMKLRLPDVPIARQQIHSTARGLVIDIETDLPVRRGLPPIAAGTDPVGSDVGVHVSASAAAELANWALDHGHGPQRFNRNLRPTEDGEFQPRFDYIAEDRKHPLKVYSFQTRGGCSFHRVGVRGTVVLDGDVVKATTFDRDLEAQSANPVIEIGAWAKYFLVGWVDQTKRIASHTRLAVGNRTLATRLVRLELRDDELWFGLTFDAAGATSPAAPSEPPSSSAPRAGRDTRRAAYRSRC